MLTENNANVNHRKTNCTECELKRLKNVRNPGRDVCFPIFIRKEIETGNLERKSKQQISRLNDLLQGVSKQTWTFFENTITPSFMEKTFPNYL